MHYLSTSLFKNLKFALLILTFNSLCEKTNLCTISLNSLHYDLKASQVISAMLIYFECSALAEAHAPLSSNASSQPRLKRMQLLCTAVTITASPVHTVVFALYYSGKS